MGRKLAAVPFLGDGNPSNTTWLGPRPTSVPSGIFVCLVLNYNKSRNIDNATIVNKLAIFRMRLWLKW